MLSIIQAPNPINYSANIPDIILSSDASILVMDILLNDELLLSERYDFGPNDRLAIKLKNLLDFFLKNDKPEYSNMVTVHSEAVKEFKINLEVPGFTNSISFSVIKGFYSQQLSDPEFYFRNYWLNLLPAVSQVYFHQPLYLTALPPSNVSVKVKAKMINGIEKTITIGNLVASKLQSVNLNPGKMIQLLGGEYLWFEAFTEDAQNKVVNGTKKFYYVEDYPFLADVFLYRNRLGGWDSIILKGEKLIKHSHANSLAIIEELEIEYFNERKLEFEKNTGFFETVDKNKQYIDFIYSDQKYFLHNGAMVPIVATENKIDQNKGKLNSYIFSFRLANTLDVHPEIGQNPSHLIIT